MTMLLIPNIEVRAANALACPWIVNAAPIVGTILFAHNLSRQLGCSGEQVAIVHHDAQLLGERPGRDGFYHFAPQQRRGATFVDARDYSSTNKHALSIQPTASFHWRLSLIIEFKGLPDIPEVERFLHHAKLAGGEIVRHGTLTPGTDAAEMCAALPNPAYWLIERRDLMMQDADPLQALFTALTEPQTLPDESDSQRTAPDGQTKPSDSPAPLPASWLTPAVLGYTALTDFAPRQGVRLLDDSEAPLHAFCEPLVGLAQYVSRRDYGERPIPFWRHGWPRPDTFIVEQNQSF